jgi:CheY-like chemotaxis protein
VQRGGQKRKEARRARDARRSDVGAQLRRGLALRGAMQVHSDPAGQQRRAAGPRLPGRIARERPRAGIRAGSGGATRRLAGKRILVVEDDFIIARLLADMLDDHGASVVGPVGRLPQALALVDREPIDAAVLDINLAGTMVFPLASELNRRNVPFLFATGYADRVSYPPDLQDATEIRKPYSETQLLEALERVLGQLP